MYYNDIPLTNRPANPYLYSTPNKLHNEIKFKHYNKDLFNVKIMQIHSYISWLIWRGVYTIISDPWTSSVTVAFPLG